MLLVIFADAQFIAIFSGKSGNLDKLGNAGQLEKSCGICFVGEKFVLPSSY